MSNLSKTFDRSRFYSLIAVAYSVAKDLHEGNERVEYYLHLAMEGWREFSFDASCEVKTVEIEIKPWKQIDFPMDMVDWVRVGFKCGDLIKILTQDSFISKLHDKVNGVKQENRSYRDINNVVAIGDMSPFYTYNGVGVAKYYGVNIDYNYLGYFDVDWKQRVINFKETVQGHTKVYLEYISDGLDASAMTVVNPYAFWVLKDWVKWQRKENDDRYSLGEKSRAESAYNKSLTKYQHRITHMDLDDVREALVSGNTLVVQI